MTPQSPTDNDTQEFDQLIDTLVQRSGLYCRTPAAQQPMMDDLHRTIELDDPTRTDQVRGFVVRIERVLRGCNVLNVRRDAIAAIVAVLARRYLGEPMPNPGCDPDKLRRIRDSFAYLAITSVHNLHRGCERSVGP